MRVNRYGSLAHYHDHMDPVWSALPPDRRGASWAPSHDQPGATLYRPGRTPENASEPVMVASFPDAMAPPARGRPVVYLEHGAGQAYEGDPAMAGAAGWSGARDPAMRRVALFLCPNETVAGRWRARYDVPAVAVGCPKMDHRHRAPRAPAGDRPTVAVTFHWDCPLGPETRTAWPYWDRALPALVSWCRRNGVEIIGHGHPRIWSRLARRWASLSIEPVRNLEDVMDRADVLVADNTSAMYEFASLDRPVVVLNAPTYRRGIEHGLRFWSHVPGRECDHHADLVPAVEEAVRHPGLHRALRSAATAAAYAHTDGHAADRAATAIMETIT